MLTVNGYQTVTVRTVINGITVNMDGRFDRPSVHISDVLFYLWAWVAFKVSARFNNKVAKRFWNNSDET